MTILFPTSIDVLTNPSASDDTSTVSHASQHANANDAIEALEAKVGIDSSAVTSSLDYKVSNAASIDPGHKHSVDGLSATGTKDATTFLRGDNTFAEPPTTSDASVTAKGVAEEATEAEIDADTAAGAQARLFVNPSTLATSKYGTNLPSDDEKAALAGTGTPNGTTGLYVTNDDVSAAAEADKVVRATGTALPALSGANLTNLPVSKRLSSSTSDITVASSTTETAIASFTLPANSLSTANFVELWIPITDLGIQNAQNTTFRLKYGATTLVSMQITSSGVSGYTGYLNARLLAAGTTSSQEGYIQAHIGSNTDTLGDSSIFTFQRTGAGTSAQDSTGDLTLQITVQHSNNNAADTITVGAYTATLSK